MDNVLKPSGKLDLAAASGLHAAFLARAEQDISLDLSEVSQMGALCLQCCIAASRQAREGGHQFDVINSADHVIAQLASMGFTPETLAEGAP